MKSLILLLLIACEGVDSSQAPLDLTADSHARTGTTNPATVVVPSRPIAADQGFSPQSHVGTGRIDCPVRSFLMAYDTPAPGRERLLALCVDPKASLIDLVDREDNSHVIRGALQLLGHFADDPAIYNRLLTRATDPNEHWHFRSAALGGLLNVTAREQDVASLATAFDVDNGPIEHEAVLLLMRTESGREVVSARLKQGDLHPAAERIAAGLLAKRERQ